MATQNILGEWRGWTARLILRGETIVSSRHTDAEPLIEFRRGDTARRYGLTTLLAIREKPGEPPACGIVLDLDSGEGLPGPSLTAVLRCAIRTLGEMAALSRGGIG